MRGAMWAPTDGILREAANANIARYMPPAIRNQLMALPGERTAAEGTATGLKSAAQLDKMTK